MGVYKAKAIELDDEDFRVAVEIGEISLGDVQVDGGLPDDCGRSVATWTARAIRRHRL